MSEPVGSFLLTWLPLKAWPGSPHQSQHHCALETESLISQLLSWVWWLMPVRLWFRRLIVEDC